MITFGYDPKKMLGTISTPSSEWLTEIREHFSVKNENAKFMRRFGRFLPPRTYAITPTGRFEPGLFFEIKKFLLNKQYTEPVNVTPELLSVVAPAFKKWNKAQIFNLNLPLRDYQMDIVKKGLECGRGTIILATAGGKTLTSATLLSSIFQNLPNMRCLFIVPDRGLVEQTTNDFLSYNVPFTVSKWTGDDQLDLNTNVIVANLGIIQSKNTDIMCFKDIDVLVIDEVHKIRKGNVINKIFKTIKTPYRYGLTGTMPEGNLDQWNIIGKIGPVIYEKHSKDLRDENYIAGADIQILKLNHNTAIKYVESGDSVAGKYRHEVDTLITSTFRNNTISKIAAQLNNNTLILVDFINHGTILYDFCQKNCNNKQIYFIRGEMEVAERDRIRHLMEQQDNIIVIAISKIFSTGINIKNLHYIIFACGGKAKIKIVQSIGRGLRLHKNKSKLIIFDIADNYKYSSAHLNKRILLYEKEQIKYAIKEIYEKYN